MNVKMWWAPYVFLSVKAVRDLIKVTKKLFTDLSLFLKENINEINLFMS